ncbi:MAG: C2H2-type zinc finger protein [Nitrososphaeraceae archaeon]
MKLSFGKLIPFRKKDDQKHICKVCKMTFQSKDSLERHKTKANHTGAVNL